VENTKDYHKLCILLVDEMQLKQHVEYDKGLGRLVGYVSLETVPANTPQCEPEELASHVLMLLRGLTSSWKQTVAYRYTGSSLKKAPYWQFTLQVLAAIEACGLGSSGHHI
jgi:hypothetical protein